MCPMNLRGARAPIALVSLLVLGVWSASAFGAGVVGTVTTAVTDTITTDTTATSPVTDTTGTTIDTTTSPGGGGVTSTVPVVTDTAPVPTATAPVPTATTPKPTVPTATTPKPPVPTATLPKPPVPTATTPRPPVPTATVPKPPKKHRPPPVVTPPPPSTVPIPSAGGQATTPILNSPGTSTTLVPSNPLVSGRDLNLDTSALATGLVGPTASAGIAAAATPASQAVKVTRIHGAKKTKRHRSRIGPVARTRPQTHASGKPASGQTKTRHASASKKRTKTTAAVAKLSRVKPLALPPKAKTPTSHGAALASGGREAATSNQKATTTTANEDRGLGFNTPQGRFSISPSGVQLGGPERPIASVGGMLSALLVSLAALAAFAGIAGLVAALRSVRRNRLASRRRARIASATTRTREQLYSEAKRQNLPGRSNMTKAELERALHPPEHVGER